MAENNTGFIPELCKEWNRKLIKQFNSSTPSPGMKMVPSPQFPINISHQ
jgi:hypothetical protein